MIIGLTGKNGCGKGVVADFLQTMGYHYHSLSDVIRDEVLARGKKITRELLTDTGNELRTTYGPSVLADRVLAKLDPEKNYIVDSVRNPFEVEALRRRKDFYLLMIDAEPKIRFERLKARGREKDPEDYDSFLKQEAKEAGSNDPNAQQLNRTCDMADAKVENNDTLEELHEDIRHVLRALAANQDRPSWDEYFMKIAQVAALRSNCIKRKVAAVIVRDQRVVSTGYNGTPRGIKNCNEGGCPRCHTFGKSGVALDECLCAHAEENAIAQAAYHGVRVSGTTLYSTYSPCLRCTKLIINSGVSEVVYSLAYPMEKIPLSLLTEAGVKVRQLETK
ncbi:MAG: AAA family ATPase [Deltaproteobacteria bacterium]|nr:AAA family ATPase [Deltaproteobacteria bacterium]MBI2341769.1 AAA family ATPase [Deltaproteobacteria bacterium]MBI2974243.1 AAA family ATPase [Deltaproteobacteria bacterium]